MASPLRSWFRHSPTCFLFSKLDFKVGIHREVNKVLIHADFFSPPTSCEMTFTVRPVCSASVLISCMFPPRPRQCCPSSVSSSHVESDVLKKKNKVQTCICSPAVLDERIYDGKINLTFLLKRSKQTTPNPRATREWAGRGDGRLPATVTSSSVTWTLDFLRIQVFLGALPPRPSFQTQTAGGATSGPEAGEPDWRKYGWL